jgi:cob(I)alamin adenosyltransferase
MVKINKIYTRTGDDGTTGLGTGQRVRKDDPRVTAYGEVDEANAALGLAVIEAERAHPTPAQDLAPILRAIQHDLFDVGADLCIPIAPGEAPGAALRVTRAQVDRLEHLIDRFNADLAPLNSFILPGGAPLAAALHLARTITRRAERATASLARQQPEQTSPLALTYLNRLSDLLFVLARIANDRGRADVLWIPGANRQPPGPAREEG